MFTMASRTSVMRNVKLVVIGDHSVGKTSLLISYTTNSFPKEYIPTVFDNYSANVMVDGQVYNLGLWDTAGQEDYDRLRPLSYPQTDIFLMCFDWKSRSSFDHLEAKWIPEINHHCPNAARVLCALKYDLKDSEAPCATEAEILHLKRKYGFAEYIPCSASTQENIGELFSTAIRAAVNGVSPALGRNPFKRNLKKMSLGIKAKLQEHLEHEQYLKQKAAEQEQERISRRQQFQQNRRLPQELREDIESHRADTTDDVMDEATELQETLNEGPTIEEVD